VTKINQALLIARKLFPKVLVNQTSFTKRYTIQNVKAEKSEEGITFEGDLIYKPSKKAMPTSVFVTEADMQGEADIDPKLMSQMFKSEKLYELGAPEKNKLFFLLSLIILGVFHDSKKLNSLITKEN
jgi:hypothetical protein